LEHSIRLLSGEIKGCDLYEMTTNSGASQHGPAKAGHYD
jgi:hypothetical protein